MATPKDTLTAYTQALNTIATQTFDPSRPIEFTYSADSTLTLTLTGGLAPGIINGHVYGITVNGLSEPIYATFLEMHAKTSGDSLKFKRLTPDAEKIIKAVLAERVAYQAQPKWTGRTLAETFGPEAFKPVSDWRAWREGEGNNP